MDILKVVFVSQNVGNARKTSVKFAFSGYADVINYQEKPMLSCERTEITEARIINVRGHKTIWSHLKYM